MTKDDMTLLINGENAFPEILRCIDEAKNLIQINMFIWRDDTIGNRIAQAILNAADHNVKVHLDVDRYGVVLEKCEENKRSFFHKHLSLSERIKIRALELFYPKNGRPGKITDEYTPLYNAMMSHPNITVSADVFKADHSKYYIIDDDILFLGGINIEDKENGHDINGRVYGDYMVKLCGKEYVRAFRHKLHTGQDTTENIRFGINRKRPTQHFEMERLYLDMIHTAKTTLHITMAYFSPLKEFTDAILAAQRRGVAVSILIPQQTNFQNDSNLCTVKKLLKASNGQIAVYLSPKMLHTKLMMNESTISLGSTNITKKAFGQLDELNLFVNRDGSIFEQALLQSVDKDITQAKRILHHQEIRYDRLLAWMENFMV